MNRVRRAPQALLLFLSMQLLGVVSGCGGEDPLPPVVRETVFVGEAGSARGTRFALMGHLYPIAKDPGRLREFLGAVNATRPDLVFVLGDSLLHDPAVVAVFEEVLEAPWHVTPGNHELKPERREAFLARFPDLAKRVVAPDCNFVLVASSMSLDQFRASLDAVLEGLASDRPTVLLTHHRIWDDTLLSPGPYQHDKSYWFDEIHPALAGRVQAIFAGNSKRQYFRDLSTSPNYGPQNLNNVFWADRIGDLTAYSVGMGDGVPKATFAVAEVVGGRLLVEPHAHVWDGRDPVDRKLVQPIRRSRAPRR